LFHISRLKPIYNIKKEPIVKNKKIEPNLVTSVEKSAFLLGLATVQD